MVKTLRKAYLCWFFGGLFGLHHLYLRRENQAFIWATTLGGFLIGLVRDLYRIPEYLREANRDKTYIEKLGKQQGQLKAPIFQFSRSIASVFVGAAFDYVTKNALPLSPTEDNESRFYANSLFYMSPLVVAFFVHMISTEGPYRCKPKWSIIGSYIAFFYDLFRGSTFSFSSPILASIFLNWNIEWNKTYLVVQASEKISKKRRIAFLSVLAGLSLFLVALFLLNNVTYEVEGKQLTLKDSIVKFFNSKEMKKLKESLQVLWNFYKAHGLKKVVNHFFYGYDAEAVAKAYKVIEMNEKSVPKDVDLKCKTLSRKWHPDKYKDPEKKLEAEKKFMEIQAACNLVSDHRRTKSKLNEKPDDL